jgi:hypothetical protein
VLTDYGFAKLAAKEILEVSLPWAIIQTHNLLWVYYYDIPMGAAIFRTPEAYFLTFP